MVVGDFTQEIDTLVIGAGPGGYVAAIRAAQLGQKVTLVDKGDVGIGGVCLNRGCIPSKALISAAHQYEIVNSAADIGINISGDVSVDFGKVQEWKNSVVNKLTGGVGALLKGNGVDVIVGEALFINNNEVRVTHEYESSRLKFNNCIIAVGSRPIELKTFPFGERILSSTEALNLQEIPKSMVVIGGGYIGIELSQAFAKFGTKITILEGTDYILPGFEKDLAKLVYNKFKKQDAEIITNAMAQGSEVTADGVKVTYKVGEETKTVEAEYVLVTVGRRSNADKLGLEVTDVKISDRGIIEVDSQSRTNVPGIYAIGDIVPGLALAHKASYEGKIAAEAIAGQPSIVDYKVIPAVVFSDPEISSVGISETEAKAQGKEISVGKFPYAANGRALSMNASEGFVKLISDKNTGIVLGAQVVGHEASNLIAELGLAIEMGATLEDIALTIHAHPTLGEMVMEAAEGALGAPIHQMAPKK